MLKYRKKMNRGDTLIEVLFAISVFSFVAVSSLSIMNQGSATAQRSLEITQVRQQIDAQAEALRFLNSSYIAAYQSGFVPSAGTPAAEWLSVANTYATSNPVSSFGNINTCPSASSSLRPLSFAINTETGKVVPLNASNFRMPSTYSKVNYDASRAVSSVEGIWVEAIKASSSGQVNADYIDFNIRACWDSPGQSVPETLGTIVRLYEPRG